MTGPSALDDGELHRLMAEDCPYGDLTTTALGIAGFGGRLTFRARGDMVVAGIEEAERMFQLAGAAARRQAASGDQVAAGALLLTAEGSAASLHRVYKVAQTFTEIWSGVASAARRLADRATAAGPAVRVACTRKNVPGTKAMAVKAIRAGGAIPHRLGLSETILVFAEHRIFLGDDWVVMAQRLRDEAPEKKLVIEVADLDEAMQAAAAGFDVIQTERFTLDMVAALAAKLVRFRPRPLIAAAAGINPDNVADYVRAGADIIVTSWPYTARPCDVKVEFARG
jgi:molybdenum transport protein